MLQSAYGEINRTKFNLAPNLLHNAISDFSAWHSICTFPHQ